MHHAKSQLSGHKKVALSLSLRQEEPQATHLQVTGMIASDKGGSCHGKKGELPALRKADAHRSQALSQDILWLSDEVVHALASRGVDQDLVICTWGLQEQTMCQT